MVFLSAPNFPPDPANAWTNFGVKVTLRPVGFHLTSNTLQKTSLTIVKNLEFNRITGAAPIYRR